LEKMNFGQSVRIYLADGIPTGIRLAEIINWTGQAIACPRIRIAELAEWSEVVRPGVYFLLQDGLGIDRGQVYIGESENVRKRLGEQVKDQEFWTEAISFTNKDDNLTKAHVRYLESRLITLAKSANRYDIVNGNSGTIMPLLPRADKAAMEEFIVNLRVVLSLLGHRLLEPLLVSVTDTSTGGQAIIPGSSPNELASTLLSFSTAGLNAYGYMTDEGFTLLKDSQVKIEYTVATPKNVIALRESAKVNGQLLLEDGYYKLLSDKAFSSSSAAACFVAGNSRSGPESWKNNAGISLKILEQQALPVISDLQEDATDAANALSAGSVDAELG
jgi:hypothetical protein